MRLIRKDGSACFDIPTFTNLEGDPLRFLILDGKDIENLLNAHPDKRLSFLERAAQCFPEEKR